MSKNILVDFEKIKDYFLDKTIFWQLKSGLRHMSNYIYDSRQYQPIRHIEPVNNNPITDTQTSNTQVFPIGYPPTFTESTISITNNI